MMTTTQLNQINLIRIVSFKEHTFRTIGSQIRMKPIFQSQKFGTLFTTIPAYIMHYRISMRT